MMEVPSMDADRIAILKKREEIENDKQETIHTMMQIMVVGMVIAWIFFLIWVGKLVF